VAHTGSHRANSQRFKSRHRVNVNPVPQAGARTPKHHWSLLITKGSINYLMGRERRYRGRGRERERERARTVDRSRWISGVIFDMLMYRLPRCRPTALALYAGVAAGFPH
jgi:hypothetical protein